MRFFWLALSIVFPLVLATFVEGVFPGGIAFFVYSAVGCLAEIVFIALCVSEFVKSNKKQEYAIHQQIRRDRDEDIKKWRKEFIRDSLDLYEMQHESLERAENLAGRSESRSAAGDSAQPNTQSKPSS